DEAGSTARSTPSTEVSDVPVGRYEFFSMYGKSAVEPLQTVKWTRKKRVWPPRSTSVPASVCGPAARLPVAKLAVEPEITGAAVGRPSSVTVRTSASASFAVTEIELAEATTVPSTGEDETTAGGVLSLRTFAWM